MSPAGSHAGDELSSLGHAPGRRWEFDETVTAVFTDMLRRSIPQYDVMRKAVWDIGSRFVVPDTCIVDLGCSQGDALAPFVQQFGPANRYLGVEVSASMLRAARDRYRSEIHAGTVDIRELDLRSAYPNAPASVTLCVLSLQFTPVDQRQRILNDVFRNTVEGGALILVEKVLGSSDNLAALMIDLYHRLKEDHGYTSEEVERKRLALEGILVPLTAKRNEELIRMAGFTQIDCFWRWMNFAGWIAVK